MIPLIYVAGPYRGKTAADVECNIVLARTMGMRIAKLGAYPVIPHSNTSHFDGLAPDEVFLEGTMRLMESCDAVVVLPGWKDSTGTMDEMARAKDLGKVMFIADGPNAADDLKTFVAFVVKKVNP